MPTLNWIGKQAVLNHHAEVPYRLLRENRDLSVGDADSGNLLIQGDNLEALKALLPFYAGQVKCIYIDPPYNTGGENWVYSDRVDSPAIRAWLDRVVGRETEDLSRHDKWLSMMYPRLTLLHKLLSDDGSLWMSIDDNAVHYARAVLDDVFGPYKFVAANVWQKRYSRENREAIGDVHEYILVYAKDPDLFKATRNRVDLDEESAAIYRNPNNDPRGRWRPIPMNAQGYRPNQMYPITAPTGKVHYPPAGRCWSVIEEEYEKLLAAGRIYFGQDGNAQPNVIRYLDEVEGLVPWTWWPHEEVGHTDEAKKELNQILGRAEVFGTPKPVRLMERIIKIASSPGDLILDSFAGSGTTGHAVLNLNAREEGEDRRFILVEMEEEVAKPITAERLRRAVEGYDYTGTDRTELLREKVTITRLKKADELFDRIGRLKEKWAEEYGEFELKIEKQYVVLYGKRTVNGRLEGIGGGYRFLDLGPELYDAEGRIRDEVTFEELARHVYFAHTGRPLPGDSPLDSARIGTAGETAVYLLYNGVLKDLDPDGGNVLTRALLAKLPEHEGPKAIYGAACTISREQLRRLGITFHQTPYEIPVR